MPLYDAHCDSCEEEYEVLCRYSERDRVVCNCGATPRFLVSTSISLIGAYPSKPIVVGGVGTFETNEDYRLWEKHNPNTEILSTKDSEWKRRVFNANQKGEETVQKWGFKDTDDWSAKTKKEAPKGGSAFTS